MKKIIYCALLLASTQTFAKNYTCSVVYDSELVENIKVIKNNVHGTQIQLNQSEKLAVVSINDLRKTRLQNVRVYFSKINEPSIHQAQEIMTTLTSRNQKIVVLSANLDGKILTLDCE